MKKVNFKVYDSDGNFIESWNDADLGGFTKEINGGLGGCQIELARNFTYTGSDLNLMNTVEVMIIDEDVSDQLTVYSGYISNIRRRIRRGEQRIMVELLGHYTKLSQDILKDGTTTEFDYSGSATEIATILQNFIDYYRAATTNPEIERTYESIEDTGDSVEHYFNMMTYREAIDKLTELAPANWYWYVGADNVFNFKARPTITTHSFRLGGDIEDIEISRNVEKLKNAMLFYAHQYDGTNNYYKLYKDTDSVDQYGRKAKIVRNDSVQTTSDADKIGTAFVAENKDPNVTIRATVIDNNESDQGYDIESIEPGETCEILGLGESLSDLMPQRFQVKRVDYELKKADIYVSPLSSGLLKRIRSSEERLDEKDRNDNVESSYSI